MQTSLLGLGSGLAWIQHVFVTTTCLTIQWKTASQQTCFILNIQAASAYINVAKWPTWRCSKMAYHQMNSHADTPAQTSGRKARMGVREEIELTRRLLQCCSCEMTLNITLIQVEISQHSSLPNFSHKCIFSDWSAHMHATDSAVHFIACGRRSVNVKSFWVIVFHIINLPLTKLYKMNFFLKLFWGVQVQHWFSLSCYYP